MEIKIYNIYFEIPVHESAVEVLVAQSCLIFCDPIGCSLPNYEILQARILERISIPFSRESSWPRAQTQVCLHCRKVLYHPSHQGSSGVGS